ncbi:MAG: hypothetical protein IJX67_12375 [Oscillospiraceae bacterium]|nr:hypothetical protein [Oscillospiraceae bacterium]MBQ9168267.1 hypothetical protein [Oscillospiraceae bacterium]MBQ9169181.1 hypothetical protein [Oscillospiraceae bacterium]
MYRKFIQDLYDGNIVPWEHPVPKDSERHRITQQATEKAERLRKNLNPQQQKLLDELLSDRGYLDAIIEQDGFALGFRLGGQCILAVLADNSEAE